MTQATLEDIQTQIAIIPCPLCPKIFGSLAQIEKHLGDCPGLR